MRSMVTSASVRRVLARSASLVAALLLLAACTVRLIAPYDEQTDKAVTALQSRLDTFLIWMPTLAGTEKGTYEYQQGFYVQSKAELSAISVRAAAIPDNEITMKQLALLADSLETVRQLHALPPKPPATMTSLAAADVEDIRTAMNTSFTAILKLELAKKRGN